MSSPRAGRGTVWAWITMSCGVAAILVGCAREGPLGEVRKLQDEGRYEESIALLRELIATEGENPEVQYRYGQALRRTGEPDLAVWALRKARESEEWAVPAGVELTQAALASRTWESAVEAATRVLEIEPDNVRILALRAEAELERLAQPERALADLERALELDADHAGLHAARVRALLMLKQIDRAREAMESLEAATAGESAPEGLRAQICAARVALDAAVGNAETAEATLRECLASFPTHPTVVGGAVAFFDERKRPQEGNRVLRNSLVEDPEALDYRSQLAARMRAAGRQQDAERLLRDGLRVADPSAATGVLTALAQHFVAVSDLPAAIEAYGAALELVDEPPPAALLAFADLLARDEQHERALEAAARLESDAYRGLIEARVHLNEHRPGPALARLDEVLDEWPDNPGARYYAARAAEQLGDFDRAVEEYRQSIRSGAAATDAGMRLAQLLSADGAHADAWVALTHHFRAHPQHPDGARLLARLAAQSNSTRQFAALLPSLEGTPAWAHAVAGQIEFAALQRGPERAISLAEQLDGVDLSLERNAPVLRALTEQLVAAGRAERAVDILGEVRERRQEVAVFHAIEGLALEGVGQYGEARLAYQRALEFDAGHAEALEGLARLSEQSGHWGAALQFLDRSSELDPERAEPLRGAAQLAAEYLSPSEATKRWEVLLREVPWDGKAALALARLRVAAGQRDRETLELARRALRFLGGEEAQQLYTEMAGPHHGELPEPRGAGRG